jgi:hypothetical protein
VDADGPLWCLTRGAVAAEPGDAVPAPRQALLWGLAQVAVLEYPGLWGGIVDLPGENDLDLRASGQAASGQAASGQAAGGTAVGGTAVSGVAADGAAALDRLCAAVAAGTVEDQLAIRGTRLLARRLTPAALGGRRAPGSWRPRGTVLVTGGTGGVGAQVARWLAAAGADRLLLVSRRGPAAPGVSRLVEELAAAGTEARAVACDVGDREALGALLAAVPAEQPLTAVFHAAAVLDDTVIDRLTPRRIEQVLRVKAGGATHLHELTAGTDLDAFVLFSSVAAAIGLPGVANYAPGNAYLDALAAHRHAAGLPATSVAWGLWGAGGMVEGAAGERLRGQGLIDMRPDLATQALAESVDHQLTTSVVLDADWERVAEVLTTARPRGLLAEVPALRRAREAHGREGHLPDAGLATGEAELSAGARLRASLADQPAAHRARTLLDLVTGHAAAVLGHRTPGAIGPDRQFRELGFDSLTAVELRNRLNTAAGVRLPMTVVFDHPTPAGLAGQLAAALETDLPAGSLATASGGAGDMTAGLTAADILADLDRIAAALPGPVGADGTGPGERAQIARRLRRLLADLAADTDGGGQMPDADDALFDLLDAELETP